MQRLNEVNPKEILIPDSHATRPIFEILRGQFGKRIVGLKRSFFNETRGGELLNELGEAKNILTEQHLYSHYLGRAASSALLTYAERLRIGQSFKKLIIVLDPWLESSERMQIDSSTIKALEIVANKRTGGKEGTLFSILKTTRTAMGARLLRGLLISPYASITQIINRLDALEECLIQKGTEEDRQEQALQCLSRVTDLDRLCSRFSTQPKQFTLRELKAEIDAVLDVRNLAIELNILLSCLESLVCSFWQELKEKLKSNQPIFAKLLEIIDEITAESPASTKKNHHLQDIFCVKADVDGMLDTARLAYAEVIKEMEKLLDDLKDKTNIGKLELKRTEGRGYHLSVPRSYENSLPSFFLQAVRHRKSILCTTADLASLNNRQARLEAEILALTVTRLKPLRASITDALHHLLETSETIAICDVILSFAETSATRNYIRPVLVNQSDGEVRIDSMRHPVLETIVDKYNPKDLVFTSGQSVVLVTGENCAGKTTFLTQFALLTIMVQIGCFVPASSCKTIMFSKICTRLATDDALEQNASTFSLEMGEMASIIEGLENLSNNKISLVLVDELGRGTSTRDGLAISAATLEYLMNSGAAKVLFSTHLLKLKEICHHFPDRVRYLRIMPSDDILSTMDLENYDYGIKLASTCGMPNEVIKDAENFRKQLLEFKGSQEISQFEEEEQERILDPRKEIFKVIEAIRKKTLQGTESCLYNEAKDLLGKLRNNLNLNQ